jgi:hypothetical protein
MSQSDALGALPRIEYRAETAVLIIADSAEGLERARIFAARSGCRVTDAVAVEDGLDRLVRQVRLDLLVIDLERDHGELLDHLLEEAEAAAAAERYGSLIVGPLGVMDVVACRTGHSRIRYLSEPHAADWLAEMALAASRTPLRLHDAGRERSAPGLLQLSEEVARIARTLAELSLEEEEREAELEPAEARREGDAIDPATIRSMIRARRMRERYFPSDLFADPAWDMMLDLMAARLEGQKVAVSSLCIAAAVPPTTALRWIKTLTDHGILVRSADPQDGRRVYIGLSDKAAAGLESYLRAVRRLAPLAI